MKLISAPVLGRAGIAIGLALFGFGALIPISQAAGVKPIVSPVTIASNNTSPTYAKVGDTVTLSFTVDQTPKLAPIITIAKRTASVSGSGTSWTASMVMTSADSNGAVPFSAVVGNSTATATTTVTAITSGSNVTFDKTPPTISSISIISSGPQPASASAGDTVTLSFSTNENARTPSVTILGHAATISGSGKTWKASIVVSAGDPAGVVSFSINASDLAGNAAAPATAITSGSAVSIVKLYTSIYCLYKPQFVGTPSYVYNGNTYTDASDCEGTTPVATLSITSTASGQSVSTTTVAKDGVVPFTQDANCINLLFTKVCLGWRALLKADSSKTTSINSGSLPYVNPGDALVVKWQIQPYQQMLFYSIYCAISTFGCWTMFKTTDLSTPIISFTNSGVVGSGFSTNNASSGTTNVTAPQDTTIFSVKANGTGSSQGGGSISYTASFNLQVDNPKGSISASPSVVNPGGSTMLTWSAKNVEDNSCTATDPAGAVIGAPNTNSASSVSTGPIPESLGSSVVYTLTCKRYSGISVSWQSNPVSVIGSCATTYDSSQPQICSFNVTAGTPLLEGGVVTLNYYCPLIKPAYALESSVDKGTTWTDITNGSFVSAAEKHYAFRNGYGPQQDTTYRLTCTPVSGSKTQGTADVVVSHPDLSSFLANPTVLSTTITSSLLTWAAQNVSSNSCKVTDPANKTIKSGNSSTGTSVSPALASLPTNYTLTCQTPASVAGQAAGGPPKASVTLYASGAEPTVDTFYANPSLVRKGANTKLYWTGTNLPASCGLSSAPVIPGDPSVVSSTKTGNSTGTTVGPINQQTLFTLTCGSNSKGQATVKIIPEYIEI
jgi:hypothetical protein